MSDPTDPAAAPPVRSSRFELVDTEGRVRAVLGDIWQRGDYTPGLAVFDRRGHERVSVALHPTGPQLSFGLHGNCVLLVGVDDPGSESRPGGAYITLETSDGQVVHQLRADERGD